MRHSRTTSPALAVPAPSLAAETVAQWAFGRAGTCMTGLSEDSTDWAE